ncbi:hypothetical protein [Mycobacterium sp. NPDC050853]|uniref:hypothetical protein n=1 Tax=Mycobacterium sp. NPDC050853 TaxID=3155160 RepID=UPI0033F0FEED
MTHANEEVARLLTPPARRPVAEMKLQISEMTVGARIGATFQSPMFGVYCTWGNIRRACHGELVLSVFSIETNGRPASDVLRFDVSGRSTPAQGPPDPARELEHGTVVRATFEDYAGWFDVIGPAVVATSAPMVGVGRWVLAYKGQLGVCLRNLDILAAPGELGLPCPTPTLSWDDGDSTI